MESVLLRAIENTAGSASFRKRALPGHDEILEEKANTYTPHMAMQRLHSVDLPCFMNRDEVEDKLLKEQQSA